LRIVNADGQEDLSPQIRASDDERDRTTRRLTEAVGDGRLTLDEFIQRVDAVYAATTRGELDTITADLPTSAEPSPPATGTVEARSKRRWKVAIMGGSELKGRWRVPAKSGHFALMGGSKIDLRDATLEASEIEITLVSIMGGNEVVVPRGVRVQVDATNIMGGNDVQVDESTVVPHSPVVHLRTYSFMGGNTVRNPRQRSK
jgi:hypothetical protein